MSLSEIHGESERVVWVHLLSRTALSAHHYAMCSQLLQGSSLFHCSLLCFVVTEDCFVLSCTMIMEYHANGGGGGSWHANRCNSEQLSFECSWILLLNNNSWFQSLTVLTANEYSTAHTVEDAPIALNLFLFTVLLWW